MNRGERASTAMESDNESPDDDKEEEEEEEEDGEEEPKTQTCLAETCEVRL